MTLATVFRTSVAVADIHKGFKSSFVSRLALFEVTGWPQEQIDTIDMIDAFFGAPTRYAFPTPPQICERCEPRFDVVDVAYGAYELAGRCPLMTLASKNEGSKCE